MWGILLVVLLCIGVTVAFCTSRSVRLKQMARTLHLRYDATVEDLLTPLACQKIYLFTRALHKFKQVLTWREPTAFIRLCEAYTFTPGQRLPTQHFTLAAAELTGGNMPSFILQPRTSADTTATHPALPAELATRFTLSAPDHFQFPAEVIGLLKATPICYLEAAEYALVYHTYQTLPVQQLQPMRFRVQQFIRALTLPSSQPTTATSRAASTLSLAELQAESLLKMQSPSRPVNASPNTLRFVYLAFGLAFVFGVLFVAQYVLRHLVH